MNDNDRENERIFSKFQPVAEPIGFRFPAGARTRLLLEYDDSGAFEETDVLTGKVVARGFLERPEKDLPAIREAA